MAALCFGENAVKKLIPNEQLTIDDPPDPLDRNAVFTFAMSFDGYEHFGSFQAAAQNARSHSRATLNDIRNELFMHARGSRHRDDDRFLEHYRATRQSRAPHTKR